MVKPSAEERRIVENPNVLNKSLFSMKIPLFRKEEAKSRGLSVDVDFNLRNPG